MYSVTVNARVASEDLPKISAVWKSKILAAIETRLTTNPQTYGKPLRRGLKGYRRLRVGDYRVIYRIEGQKVSVMAIQHRAVAYKHIDKWL